MLGVPLVPLRPVVSVVGLSTGNFSQWTPIKPGPPEQGLMGKNPTLSNYTTTGNLKWLPRNTNKAAALIVMQAVAVVQTDTPS